jgi:CRP-like cAMP-binding protein
VKTTRLGLSGVEVILRLWVSGDVLGPVDLFAGGRHSSTAQAFRLTQAPVWDASSFKALADRYPVDQNLLRMVVRYWADLEERFRELTTERVGPRVARQLVRLLPPIGRTVNGPSKLAFARRAGANDRYDAVRGQPAVLGLGDARTGQGLAGKR